MIVMYLAIVKPTPHVSAFTYVYATIIIISVEIERSLNRGELGAICLADVGRSLAVPGPAYGPRHDQSIYSSVYRRPVYLRSRIFSAGPCRQSGSNF